MKYLLAFSVIALATGATAFSATPQRVFREKSTLYYQPSQKKRVPSSSLQRIPPRSIEDVTEQTSAGTSLQIASPLASTDEPSATETQEESLPSLTRNLGIFTLLLFTTVTYFLLFFLNEPCVSEVPWTGANGICTEDHFRAATFFQEHKVASFGLILTHAIPFALMPTTMAFIGEKGEEIQKDHPKFNPFVMQLGMAVIALGLALEFGWHVSDSWYYINNFHILNFGFYFFLISGFALWADGFESEVAWDIVFGVVLLAATVLYPLGQYYGLPNNHPEGLLSFLENPSNGKIPLYAGMSATFLAITKRGLQVFGNKMWIVAFLSLGVNLAFIFVLNGYAGIPADPNADLQIQNYIYHICHDVLGTEAGVLYFALLVKNYKSPPPPPYKERNN